MADQNNNGGNRHALNIARACPACSAVPHCSLPRPSKPPSRSPSASTPKKPAACAATARPPCSRSKIWAEEVNAKGGLLGRPVKLVYYDDQSNPALVPGIITKLLDVDKVDILHRRQRHQHAGARPADRHAAQPDLPRLVRARREQRVPLSELFLDHPGRRRAPARGVLARLLRGGRGDGSEAEDHRAGRRRRGVLQERGGRCARAGEAHGLEDRL